MHIAISVADGAGFERDLEVTADHGTRLADLAALLPELRSSDQPLVFADGEPLPASALLGEEGLRSGCVLTTRFTTRRAAGSILQLRVCSGPDCGAVLPLARGVHLIGRTPPADIVIDDPDISRRHAELTVDADGISIRDLESANGIWVNSIAVKSGRNRVSPGSCIRLGDSRLQVIAANEPPAAVRATDGGLVLVNRAPRVVGDRTRAAIEFPPLNTSLVRPKVHWLPALLPAVLAVALAMFLHNVEFLAFGLLGPITLGTQTIVDRGDYRRATSSQGKADAVAESAARAALDRQHERERLDRLEATPDAAAVGRSALAPDRRLWERRIDSAEFLLLRLGIADLPAHTVALRGGQPLPVELLTDVPAVVDLRVGAVGVAGPQPMIRAVSRWLLAQVLALHSPSDLQVIALLDEDSDDWRWLRWVGAAVSSVATDETARRRAVEELSELVELRLSRMVTGQVWTGPWVVVFVDPARSLTVLPVAQTLLSRGKDVGVTVLCADTSAAFLPVECRATVHVTGETGTRLDVAVTGHGPVTGVVADGVSLAWAESFGRALAPLRDGEATSGGALPADVALVELLRVRPAEPESVLDSWTQRVGAGTPIGVAASGTLDVDLVRDGPHILIAGTTGSGKSELLRTLVLGLAARHAPDDVAFVLVDYKGGAAFAGCADLPHTLGLVTDLDSHLTSRVLTSLDAEVRRREAAFAEAGVSDLDSYRTSPVGATAPLARLVLVIDEFATLAEELPTFLKGLISVAQRGRSLGLHLVLATQRPAGVVSPEIKANVSLRIALRVTDPGESADIIGSDAAAEISRRHPGRALARLGDGLVQFQVARVGLPVRPPGTIRIRELGPWHEQVAEDRANLDDDDLRPLLDAIAAAHRMSARPLLDPPWLPALTSSVTAADLPAPPLSDFEIAFGLVDDPGRQRQSAAVHDLAGGGSIGFAGGPRSGRTTALRTMSGRATAQLDANHLHLYVIDCAGHSFRQLADLPHTGAVLDADHPHLVSRLIMRLVAELTTRQKLLAEHGVASLAEARAVSADLDLPAILVALDGWEGFTALSEEFDAGRSTELLLQLLRDSAAVGMTFLITGDRALLGVRIGSVLQRRLLLRLTDRGDYAMAGLRADAIPDQFPPGRVLSVDDGLETQLALLAPDPSASAQTGALLAQARADHQPQWARGPIRVRPLPSSITRAELDNLGFSPGCLLGVGGDEAAPVACDLFAPGSKFLIAGPARSGRSTAVITVAEQALASGLVILVAAPARSAAAAWARDHGFETHEPASHNALSRTDYDLVLVDEAEQFTDTEVGHAIGELVAASSVAVACAARTDDLLLTYRGIAADVRRHRTGLLLQPGPADGDLLGIRVAASRAPLPPGRGLLVTDDTRQLSASGQWIQVAR